jgi:ADP-L-glycero-D-manno-heptose 6-epimerase
MNKYPIVTGHMGFIGSHLLDALQPYKPLGIDARTDNIETVLEDIKWKDVSQIYHIGAISSTQETDITKLWKHNVEFSIKLFEKAIEYQIPVVYASSAAVYGNTMDNGRYELQPLNYYATTKVWVDQWVMNNMDRFKHVVGLRYFNVYGPRENKPPESISMVSKFINQAKADKPILLFDGSENTQRDFVHVYDVVKATIEAMARSPGIVDVGTGSPMRILRLAQEISIHSGAPLQFIPFPEKFKEKYQFFTKSQLPRSGYIRVSDYIASINYCNEPA